MAFHHALVKSLAAAGLVAVATGDTVAIVMEGVTITTGPIADVKALAADAKKTVSEDDFDLDAFVERGVVLHLDPIADDDIGIDEAVATEDAVAADARPAPHLDVRPHLGALADRGAVFDTG